MHRPRTWHRIHATHQVGDGLRVAAPVDARVLALDAGSERRLRVVLWCFFRRAVLDQCQRFDERLRADLAQSRAQIAGGFLRSDRLAELEQALQRLDATIAGAQSSTRGNSSDAGAAARGH